MGTFTYYARIETDRCGWPSIAPLGENGEIVVSHYAGNQDGIAINTRATKGTGDWTEVMYMMALN